MSTGETRVCEKCRRKAPLYYCRCADAWLCEDCEELALQEADAEPDDDDG